MHTKMLLNVALHVCLQHPYETDQQFQTIRKPYLNCSKAAFWQIYPMAVNVYSDISKPGHCGRAPILILGLHTKVGQPRGLPARPGQQVGAGPLEVVEEAVKCVVVGVSEHHAGAGACGLTVVGALQLFAGLQLSAWSLLAEDLVIHIQTAAPLGALVRQPEHLPPPVKSTWTRQRSDVG